MRSYLWTSRNGSLLILTTHPRESKWESQSPFLEDFACGQPTEEWSRFGKWLQLLLELFWEGPGGRLYMKSVYIG